MGSILFKALKLVALLLFFFSVKNVEQYMYIISINIIAIKLSNLNALIWKMKYFYCEAKSLKLQDYFDCIGIVKNEGHSLILDYF